MGSSRGDRHGRIARARAGPRTPRAAGRCPVSAALPRRDDIRRATSAPHSIRAMTEAARITLVEVAPRDGLQAEARTLSTETKIALIERLADAGHITIEATSFVSPKAVPQLADAEELMRRLKRRAGVRYSALVPNETGLERAISSGVHEIAVFASASESYSRKNLNRSRDDALAGYGPVIRKAKDARLRVRGYLS